MLAKRYLNKLRKHLHAYALKRVEVIEQSNKALHHAKRAIFALHRGNLKEAREKLRKTEQILKALNKKFAKDNRIKDEGAYKAGLEEYVEAKLFYGFVTANKIGEVKELLINNEVYLAGLCDVPGELYRYAVKAATNKDVKTVKLCAQMAQDIVGELIEFNLTSYLRTKFDQAKIATNKLEQVVYELSLRDN